MEKCLKFKHFLGCDRLFFAGLKSVIKRPLPFFEDLDDHSDKIQSKKQKLNEDSVR